MHMHVLKKRNGSRKIVSGIKYYDKEDNYKGS